MPENIGELKCHICGELETAFIRKKKKGGGNYPLYLWHSKTGPQFYNKAEGQDWILTAGIFYDENGNLPGKESDADPVEESTADPVEESTADPVEESTADPVEEPADDEEKEKDSGLFF